MQFTIRNRQVTLGDLIIVVAMILIIVSFVVGIVSPPPDTILVQTKDGHVVECAQIHGKSGLDCDWAHVMDKDKVGVDKTAPTQQAPTVGKK